jgi:HSP20 family protein
MATLAEAAARCFSWSNRDAILMLPEHIRARILKLRRTPPILGSGKFDPPRRQPWPTSLVSTRSTTCSAAFSFGPLISMGAAQQPPSIKMDVKDQGDNYLVHAELPGVAKEDIHVVVDGNQVSISAETKQEKETKEGERVLRSERYFGKVSRSFQLEQEIDDSQGDGQIQRWRARTDTAQATASPSKRLTIA